MAKTKDLTQGSVWKLLLVFAFPTLLSNVFQQFYNLADTAIAGHILGDNALVAIGASSTINSLVLSFAWGLNGGFGIIIAQCFGAKDFKRLKKSVAISLVINAAFSVAVLFASVLFSKPMLKLLNTPSARLREANSYIVVILACIIVPMLYNLEAVILRSLGDSKTPLYFLIFSSILNVVLDYVFIKFTNMGVMGAAVATVLAQLLSVIFCFVVILKNFKIIRLKKDDFKFSSSLFKNMMGAGMTMAVMNSIFSIGSIIMQGSINALGDDIIAAHLSSRKVAEMFMQPLVTIGTACSTFVGQNYGAGKIKRIKSSIKYSTIYSLVWSVLTFFVLWFFGGQIARLVTGSASQTVFENTQLYLRVMRRFILFWVCFLHCVFLSSRLTERHRRLFQVLWSLPPKLRRHICLFRFGAISVLALPSRLAGPWAQYIFYLCLKRNLKGLIILNLKKRQNDSRWENESKSSLQSLTRKEIKNPSEKNQEDFCFLCEIIINAKFQQFVFYNSRTHL